MKHSRNLLFTALLAALSTPALAEVTIDVIGGSEISFEGLVQADGNWFDNDVADLNGAGRSDSEFELRRAELIVKGKGPGMLSWVVDCPPAELAMGMPVEVVFEDVTPEITLPKFRRARS